MPKGMRIRDGEWNATWNVTWTTDGNRWNEESCCWRPFSSLSLNDVNYTMVTSQQRLLTDLLGGQHSGNQRLMMMMRLLRGRQSEDQHSSTCRKSVDQHLPVEAHSQ